MITRISKWGNSLGLRIPKSFAREAHIEARCEIDLTLKGGRLIATPLKRSKLTLAELLGKVTRKNVHGEVDSDRPVGREHW